MTVTRRSLHDEITRLDAEIEALQEDKRGAFEAYREQLAKDGHGKSVVRLEIDAFKTAERKLRALAKNGDLAVVRDGLVDEIVAELQKPVGTQNATRARAPRESGIGSGANAEPHGRPPSPTHANENSDALPEAHQPRNPADGSAAAGAVALPAHAPAVPAKSRGSVRPIEQRPVAGSRCLNEAAGASGRTPPLSGPRDTDAIPAFLRRDPAAKHWGGV